MRKLISLFLFTTFLAFVISGCGPRPSPTPVPEVSTPTPAAAPSAAPEKGGPIMAFELTSTAFAPGGPIPQKYSCDGEDISPPLQWSDPPQGTQSLALICDDPDAPVAPGSTGCSTTCRPKPVPCRRPSPRTLSCPTAASTARTVGDGWTTMAPVHPAAPIATSSSSTPWIRCLI